MLLEFCRHRLKNSTLSAYIWSAFCMLEVIPTQSIQYRCESKQSTLAHPIPSESYPSHYYYLSTCLLLYCLRYEGVNLVIRNKSLVVDMQYRQLHFAGSFPLPASLRSRSTTAAEQILGLPSWALTSAPDGLGHDATCAVRRNRNSERTTQRYESCHSRFIDPGLFDLTSHSVQQPG